jgi:hypothetical protein
VGKVWDFIRSQPGLWTRGHNIFLYHHPKQPGAPILCDFGVEVTRIGSGQNGRNAAMHRGGHSFRHSQLELNAKG